MKWGWTRVKHQAGDASEGGGSSCLGGREGRGFDAEEGCRSSLALHGLFLCLCQPKFWMFLNAYHVWIYLSQSIHIIVESSQIKLLTYLSYPILPVLFMRSILSHQFIYPSTKIRSTQHYWQIQGWWRREGWGREAKRGEGWSARRSKR